MSHEAYYQTETVELKPQIQEFVLKADANAWRKLNTDQRAQILTALQRFGIIGPSDIVGLNWLLEPKALDVLSIQHLKIQIDKIRQALQAKISAAVPPQIPDLEPPLPKKQLEKLLGPHEAAERFQKFGIDLYKTRLQWGQFYLHNTYWKDGEKKVLPIPPISEASMQQFERALEDGSINAIAFDDNRLGDGEATKRLTGLNNSALINELDMSFKATSHNLRQIILLNEQPSHHLTRADKKILRKAKRQTESYVGNRIVKDGFYGKTGIQLIGYSYNGHPGNTIEGTAQKLKQNNWSCMSIGTINRILAFLEETDPDAATAFICSHSDASFANNFTHQGKPIGLEFVRLPESGTAIAAPRVRNNIYAKNDSSPFIPMLVSE